MSEQIRSFAVRHIGPKREMLEDYSVTQSVTTASGLKLEIGIVCDGVGGGDWGERAAYLTAHTILTHIEKSSDSNIADMMVKAVEEANRRVYREANEGKSTVAMAVVHYDDSPYGRLYIANVGDSRIYLIRQKQLIQLTVDHIVASEMILDGKATAEEAYSFRNAYHLTRAIGVGETVNVDIGFYYNLSSREEALEAGRQGIQLQAGDTLVACSDGLVNINPEDNKPYVRDSEFIHHAMDDDVERAANTLISYALMRGPSDNVSIALMFVPSPDRKSVTTLGRVGARTRAALILVPILVGIAVVAAVFFLAPEEGNSQEAANRRLTQAFADLTQTATLWTPTPTPSPTATVTPSPTSTIRPTPVEGELGRWFPVRSSASIPVVRRMSVEAEVLPGYLVLDGGEFGRDPANFFLEKGTSLQTDALSNVSQSIEMIMAPDGDFFMQNGEYTIETTLREQRDLRFTSRGECMAMHYETETTLSVSCYSGGENVCFFNIDDPEKFQEDVIPGYSRIVFDLELLEPVPVNEQGEVVRAIPQEEAERYYELITELGGDPRRCLGPYIDPDGDNILLEADVCPELAGVPSANGCPDQDGDSVQDAQDACPDVAGLPALNGCPDRDGDGVPDNADRCPDIRGTRSNGCPPQPRS